MTLLSQNGLSRSFWQRCVEGFKEEQESWRRGSLLFLFPILPLLLGGVVGVYRWQTDRAVSQREKTAVAAITSQEGRRFRYQFSVDATSYAGWSSPKLGMGMGQEIAVFYDPINPQINSAEDLADSSYAWLGFGTTGLAIGVPLVVILIRNRGQDPRARS